jgi:outer membrane lipoprotein-sorting protein
MLAWGLVVSCCLGHESEVRAQRHLIRPLTAAEVGRKVEVSYAATTTLTARFFEQRIKNDGSGTTALYKGNFSFAKPNWINWAYDDGNRVLSDGQQMAAYDPATKKVVVRPVNLTSFIAQCSFLTSPQLTSAFTLSTSNDQTIRSGVEYGLMAERLVAPNKTVSTLFHVDSLTFKIERVRVSAGAFLGDYLLIAVKENVSLPPSEFQMVLPAGTTVDGPIPGFVSIASANH